MRFKSIALAGGAAIALAVGMMGASYANTGFSEVRETQQLNNNELTRVTAHQSRAVKKTVKAPNNYTKLTKEVGNKVMRAMSTKHAAFPKREINRGVALDELRRPAQTIATASVQTKNGDVMGEVKSVEIGANGEPRTINVETGGFLGVGERVVPIRAKTFVYLPKRDILVTSLTREQVEALPPARSNI